MTLYFGGKKYNLPRSLDEEQAEEFAKRDEIAKHVLEEMKPLKDKYEKKIKLTRRIYCKYCYKNTKPVLNWFDGLIKCGTCDYGLWPLQSEQDIEDYINNPDLRQYPQYLSMLQLKRRADAGDKEAQKHYNFFSGKEHYK